MTARAGGDSKANVSTVAGRTRRFARFEPEESGSQDRGDFFEPLDGGHVVGIQSVEHNETTDVAMPALLGYLLASGLSRLNATARPSWERGRCAGHPSTDDTWGPSVAKNIKKFVNREFSRTVELNLIRRLVEPYGSKIKFDFTTLPIDEKSCREALFEFFRSADESFPSEFQDALHCIMVLSNPNGLRLLQEQADRVGVQLIPEEETQDPQGGVHLTPRHVALRAYLDHRAIFDRALDLHAFIAPASPMEFVGVCEGVKSRHEDLAARETFRRAASEYFSKRYLGQYCDVRWYSDGDEINILVLHGKNAVTANVEQNGEERVLTFREIAQDTIRYHAPTGRLKTSAQHDSEKKKLAELFALHLLGDGRFFDGDDSQNLYTLQPINDEGPAFLFRSAWDEDLIGVRITEVHADEGEPAFGGRRRYSRWGMLVRDHQNAMIRLAELAPDLDLATARLISVKVEFTFRLHGKERRIIVKIKPPGLVSFRRDAFEARIMEHLRRNGLCVCRQTDPVAAAAE